MLTRSPYHTFQRYRTQRTHRISALPIVILMPHSACNCRCVMCDIWKDNTNLRELTPEQVEPLLRSLVKWGTHTVVMSGGEALLNRNFFTLCRLFKAKGIRISLLSTGLLLGKHAAGITEHVDEVIVSLDGDEAMHDAIRNIPGAYRKLANGIAAIHALKPGFRVTARSVIHRLNYTSWMALIESAKTIGIQQVSFLPADVSSHAFNREQPWGVERQHEILPAEEQLPALQLIIDAITARYKSDPDDGFIAEPVQKLQHIHDYYAAFYGRNLFPFKKCNAPWVSTVIEADGTVRPCFFHAGIGNIHEQPLADILNSEKAIGFRRGLDVEQDPTCVKCVCYLNLPLSG